MAIQRADLENKLREIEVIVNETKEQARSAGTMIAVAAVVGLVIMYVMGKRSGKKVGAARVEVFRLR